MSKYKFKGSLIIDALLAFFIVSTITMILIPMFSNLNNQYLINLNNIKIKQIMITSLQHYKKKELYQGVVIENYEIQLFNNKICGEDKAFTYIEALFALFVTTLILALLPTILKLTSFYLNTAQNNEDIQFEFFRRDLLKEKMTTQNNYEIENAYTIKLKKDKDVIRYIYKNRKIYKNINQKGNITLLNHVLSTRILKTNDNIVKLLITTGETNDEHKEILFI